MAITYPTTLDNFVDPVATDKRDSPSLAEQITDIHSALEQLETIVGVTGSAVPTTHTYKLATLTSPGIILLYGAAAAPTGWLLCDGSAVSRTTYASLFAVIGTTYGIGDGSTTFNVPNLKGKFPVGFNSADTAFDALGETGGAQTANIAHTHTGPSHTHDTTSLVAEITLASSNIQINRVSTSSWDATHKVAATIPAGDTGQTTGANIAGSTDAGGTGATGSSLSSTQSILPPYITLNYIIKV